MEGQVIKVGLAEPFRCQVEPKHYKYFMLVSHLNISYFVEKQNPISVRLVNEVVYNKVVYVILIFLTLLLAY